MEEIFTIKDYRNIFTLNLSYLLSDFADGAEGSYDNYILSALGGRVCYSKQSPVEMLYSENADKRILDISERKKYLNRIRNKHHYSIFAHSPVTVVNSEKSYFTGLYKTFPFIDHTDGNNQTVIEILNARHFIENLDYYRIEMREEIDDFILSVLIGGAKIGFISKGFEPEFDYAKSLVNNEPEQYVIINSFSIPRYGYWIFAITHGFSRVFTHQLVRHTFFNFSQRSFRFTNTMGIVIPDAMKELFSDPNFECSQNYDQCYWNLINEYRAKKEDARYLYPMGARTTIMFSGPLFVFQDFVEKRLDKAAQLEIRKVAYLLNEYIKRFIGEEYAFQPKEEVF